MLHRGVIDWLAVYGCPTDRIFYIPAAGFETGMFEMTLRLKPARNNQTRRIRLGTRYTTI